MDLRRKPTFFQKVKSLFTTKARVAPTDLQIMPTGLPFSVPRRGQVLPVDAETMARTGPSLQQQVDFRQRLQQVRENSEPVRRQRQNRGPSLQEMQRKQIEGFNLVSGSDRAIGVSRMAPREGPLPPIRGGRYSMK